MTTKLGWLTTDDRGREMGKGSWPLSPGRRRYNHAARWLDHVVLQMEWAGLALRSAGHLETYGPLLEWSRLPGITGAVR